MRSVFISEEGMFTLLRGLNKRKATQPENIPNIFIKRCAVWIAKFYALIFNASLTQHFILNEGRLGCLAPIHKTGDLAPNVNAVKLQITQCR